MKLTTDRDTSKNTRDNSGREAHDNGSGHTDNKSIYGGQADHGRSHAGNLPNAGDKRYIRRDIADGRFPSGSMSRGLARNNRRRLVGGALHLDISQPEKPIVEKPDFTEADKEWIDKIDRTKLSWDDWD